MTKVEYERARTWMASVTPRRHSLWDGSDGGGCIDGIIVATTRAVSDRYS